MAGFSEIEQRIRRLCYTLIDTSRQIGKARNDVDSLYQGLMAVASLPGNRECDVTVSGTVSPRTWFSELPGVLVEVWYPDNTGTMLGSDTTDASGNYSITGSIPSAGVSATIYFSRARYVSEADAITLACGSLSWSATLDPASGYEQTRLCNVALSDTLTIIDADYGTHSVTFGISPGVWTGAVNTGPFVVLWTFDPNATGVEPNIVTADRLVGGIGTGHAGSTSSIIGCSPFGYVGSGPGTVNLYPSGTGNWTITDP